MLETITIDSEWAPACFDTNDCRWTRFSFPASFPMCKDCPWGGDCEVPCIVIKDGEPNGN